MRESVPDPADRFVDPDRLGRLRDVSARAGVDGLLALSPANSYYVTGAYAGMYSRPVMGVVTPETSVFGGPFLEKRRAERTSWVDECVVYEDDDDPFDVLAAAVPDVDVLGYDRAYARPDWVEELDRRLNADLVTATDELLAARARKTDWEVAMMRRASDLATAGTRAYLDGVRAGRPELDVVDEIQTAYYDTYLRRHAEYDVGTANELGQYGFASVLAGERALEPHSLSSAREIADGDNVVGIALPALQGYVCEEERTVLVGDVDPEVRTAMETLVSVRRDVIDRIEAGRGTDELDARAVDRLEAAGYGDNVVHRTGHGEGITIHEGPALNARESGTLEAGMVISVEPGLYFEDAGVALRHSDTLVVTERGAERLTDTDDGVLTA